jgi:hypothetical protein
MAKNVIPFCPCPETLWETELKVIDMFICLDFKAAMHPDDDIGIMAAFQQNLQ